MCNCSIAMTDTCSELARTLSPTTVVQPTATSLDLLAATATRCSRLQPQEYAGSPPAQVMISELGSDCPLQQHHVGSDPPALTTPTLLSYAESMVRTTSTQPEFAKLQVKHAPESYPHPPIFSVALPLQSTQSALSYLNGTTSFRPIPLISPMSAPGSVQSFTLDSKTQDLTCVNNGLHWPPATPFSPIYPAQLRPQPSKRRFPCTCQNCVSGINNEAVEKQHICDYPGCGRVFQQSSYLKIHIRSHTGEKPFICNWPNCGKRFTRSSELNRHTRSHTGEKRYICRECDKRFTRRDHLTSHEKTHQKIREQKTSHSQYSSDCKEPPNTPPSTISSPLPERPPIPSEASTLSFTEHYLGGTAAAAITEVTNSYSASNEMMSISSSLMPIPLQDI